MTQMVCYKILSQIFMVRGDLGDLIWPHIMRLMRPRSKYFPDGYTEIVLMMLYQLARTPNATGGIKFLIESIINLYNAAFLDLVALKIVV